MPLPHSPSSCGHGLRAPRPPASRPCGHEDSLWSFSSCLPIIQSQCAQLRKWLPQLRAPRKGVWGVEGILVSFGCHYKSPRTGWVRTTDTYPRGCRGWKSKVNVWAGPCALWTLQGRILPLPGSRRCSPADSRIASVWASFCLAFFPAALPCLWIQIPFSFLLQRH